MPFDLEAVVQSEINRRSDGGDISELLAVYAEHEKAKELARIALCLERYLDHINAR